MAGRMRTRIKKRKARERAQIREAEARALEQMESGQTAIDDLRSQLPTYEQLLGDMPTSSRLEMTPEDQRLRDVEMRALERLEQVGAQGWTPEERAALDAAQRQTALQEQAQRQAVMQQAQMRGMGGSGAALAGSLIAQQAGANRNADVAAQMGMAGRDRALQAIESGAGLASSMGAQNMQRAGAIDAFNQWATGHRSDARQGAFANQAGVAGMQMDWAPQSAAFFQGRADAVRQRRQDRRQFIRSTIRDLGEAVASLWKGSSDGGGGGGGGGGGTT